MFENNFMSLKTDNLFCRIEVIFKTIRFFSNLIENSSLTVFIIIVYLVFTHKVLVISTLVKKFLSSRQGVVYQCNVLVFKMTNHFLP